MRFAERLRFDEKRVKYHVFRLFFVNIGTFTWRF